MGLSRGAEVALELLLTARAFQAGGEEAADHFSGVDQPDEDQTPLQKGREVGGKGGSPHAGDGIQQDGREEQKGAVDQLDIVEAADESDPPFGLMGLVRFHECFLFVMTLDQGKRERTSGKGARLFLRMPWMWAMATP